MMNSTRHSWESTLGPNNSHSKSPSPRCASMSQATHGTNHQSAQANTDQLAVIARFLDELEAKAPIKQFQKETDGNKTLLDTINALIAVGAFIAGVQTQLVIVSGNFTSTVLDRAMSWFAFAGLTLDLIGTSAGVGRALLLQQSIRRAHRLSAQLVGQIDRARHELRELQQQRGNAADPSAVDFRAHVHLTQTVRLISRIVELLADDGRFGGTGRGGVRAAENIKELEEAATAALDVLGPPPLSGKHHDLPFRRLLWGPLPYVSVDVQGLGYVPVASLAGGALCLLASVILFAGASQPRFIWISCTSIAICMLSLSIVPTNKARKYKRTALYDRVEATLQQCPPIGLPVFPAPEGRGPGTPAIHTSGGV
ncbi:hypothetical protein BJV78DRAFT_1184763 [Lactifluus subvellereus]|nr:hypothetical protein BJV78DRAFT_1184763 [Lactifluus subvellereus]